MLFFSYLSISLHRLQQTSNLCKDIHLGDKTNFYFTQVINRFPQVVSRVQIADAVGAVPACPPYREQRTENRVQITDAVGASLVGAQKVES